MPVTPVNRIVGPLAGNDNHLDLSVNASRNDTSVSAATHPVVRLTRLTVTCVADNVTGVMGTARTADRGLVSLDRTQSRLGAIALLLLLGESGALLSHGCAVDEEAEPYPEPAGFRTADPATNCGLEPGLPASTCDPDAFYEHPFQHVGLVNGKIPLLDVKDSPTGERYAVGDMLVADESGAVTRTSGLFTLERRPIAPGEYEAMTGHPLPPRPVIPPRPTIGPRLQAARDVALDAGNGGQPLAFTGLEREEDRPIRSAVGGRQAATQDDQQCWF